MQGREGLPAGPDDRRHDVEPGGRDVVGLQVELDLLGHNVLLVMPDWELSAGFSRLVNRTGWTTVRVPAGIDALCTSA